MKMYGIRHKKSKEILVFTAEPERCGECSNKINGLQYKIHRRVFRSMDEPIWLTADWDAAMNVRDSRHVFAQGLYDTPLHDFEYDELEVVNFNVDETDIAFNRGEGDYKG